MAYVHPICSTYAFIYSPPTPLPQIPAPHADENSPLTPLLPLEHHQRNSDATRFGFSPLTVNRLLAQGTTPTVLKTSAAGLLSVSSAAVAGGAVDLASGVGGGAIRKRYSVPNNSPMQPAHPPPPPPDVVLAAALSSHIHKRPTTVGRSDRHGGNERTDVNNNISADGGESTNGNRLAVYSKAQQTDIADQHTPLSSHDMRRPAATPSAPTSKLDSALVVNILEDNRLGHLSTIFLREEIDLDVFCMMDRSELAQIGVCGEDCVHVLEIIQSLNKL